MTEGTGFATVRGSRQPVVGLISADRPAPCRTRDATPKLLRNNGRSRQDAVSVHAQSSRRVHARRAHCGHQSGQTCDQKQKAAHARVGHGVHGTDLEE